MTLTELCFIIATVVFIIDALPMIKLAFPFKMQSVGLAFVAFALALGAGLAARLGAEGKLF